MAQVDPDVMALVESELEKDPAAGSLDLFEKAKAAIPSVAELSIRQFHARYPLQVKRRASAGKARRRRKKLPPTQPGPSDHNRRSAVRAVLMRFATDLASAEAKADVVKVLADSERYVDELIGATKR
jgi:hypothetical protein